MRLKKVKERVVDDAPGSCKWRKTLEKPSGETPRQESPSATSSSSIVTPGTGRTFSSDMFSIHLDSHHFHIDQESRVLFLVCG